MCAKIRQMRFIYKTYQRQGIIGPINSPMYYRWAGGERGKWLTEKEVIYFRLMRRKGKIKPCKRALTFGYGTRFQSTFIIFDII